MCNKAILENDGTLKSVSDCYRRHKTLNKGIDNYPHAFKVVPDCYQTK